STECSGVQLLNLPDNLNGKPSLTDKQTLELSKIGIKIEEIFRGNPQDIEWAIGQNGEIFILQTRPITSKGTSMSSKIPIYSRGYSDDYWNDDTTPLFFDLLGSQITKVVNIELNSIMGYKRINDQLIKLHKGHVYFNLDVLKRKVEYEIPTFIRNEDVLNYFPNGHSPYGKETMKKLPFRLIKRLISELRIRFYDPDGRMSKTAEKYEEWTHNVFEPYCKEFDLRLRDLGGDLKALFKLAEDFDKKMISHFRLIRYGIPVHNIGMNLMTQYLLTRFFGKEEAQRIFPILISGLNHKLTETNDRIHELGLIWDSKTNTN
ncbi:MAG: PEP/pyruvate-binding domain-containing protein, partial [Candidatus Lokiarchaeota archaeon]